jgi:hypothetical protein
LTLDSLTLSNPNCSTEGPQIHRGFAGKVSTKEAIGGGNRGGGAAADGHGHFVFELAAICLGEKLE